jgi:hypothetical protein
MKSLTRILLCFAFLIAAGLAAMPQSTAAAQDPPPTPTVVSAIPPADPPLSVSDAAATAFHWYDGSIQYSTILNCIGGYPEYGVGTYVGYWASTTYGEPEPYVIYYLHVIAQTVGNACAGIYGYFAVDLPANTSLAISTENPVKCYIHYTELTQPYCPQVLPESAYYPGSYEIPAPEDPWVWPMPLSDDGWPYEFLIPVMSTTTLSGSTFQANVWTLDGNSSPTLTPTYGIYVFSPFVKSAPANGATNQSINPTLSWGSATAASSYQYCIDTSNNGTCNASWISTGTATSKALSGLAPGTTYSWQVRVNKPEGIVIYANAETWWTFTTAAETCYTLTRTHTGSGGDPTAAPTSSSGCAAGKYHAGESISLTASPAAGWNVGSWSGTNNNSSTSTTNTVTMPAGNRTVTVNYVAGGCPLKGMPLYDFNGDCSTDIAVYRPSTYAWYVRGQASVYYGASGDLPRPGDYNGDGTTDIAVYRPSTGAWYIRGQSSVYYGSPGDKPVPGDYNGDGTTDIAVFRPSTGAWYIRGQSTVYFGSSGDIPIPGDYDGDGAMEIAVFRPSTGAWYVRGMATVYYGVSTDIPVPGDYNGDGTVDIAVYRPSTGAWYVRGQTSLYYGASTDIPVPGDYNGDGTTDVAVFRPSTGAWYIRGQTSLYYGASGDIPLPELSTGKAGSAP